MAPLKSPTEWSKAVKYTTTGIASIAGIIALFLSFESWTDEKIAGAVTSLEKKRIEAAARTEVAHEINHDKIIQSQRFTEATISIKVTQLELDTLEDEIEQRRVDGLQITVHQERARARLIELLRIWEAQQKDAQQKLAQVASSSEAQPR